MDVKQYVEQTKDIFSADELIGRLKRLQKETRFSGRYDLYMLATAQLRYREDTIAGDLPLNALSMYRSLIDYSKKRDKQVYSLAVVKCGCATADVMMRYQDIEPSLYEAISAVIGYDIGSLEDLCEWRMNLFLKGFRLATGAEAHNAHEALKKAKEVEPGEVPECMSYSVAALANELVSASEIDMAYDTLEDVCERVDPTWQLGRMFAAQNRIRKYVLEQDLKALDQGEKQYETIARNLMPSEQVDKLNSLANKEETACNGDIWELAAQSTNPPLLHFVARMLGRIRKGKLKDVAIYEDFFGQSHRTGGFH